MWRPRVGARGLTTSRPRACVRIRGSQFRDLSRVVGSRSGGRLGEDANPNGDRTNDGFLVSLSSSPLGVFPVLGRFLDLLATSDICRNADIEIPVLAT